MPIQNLFRIVARFSLVGIAAAGLSACVSAPTPSSRMALGGAVMAPVGMVGFCQREPAQCEAPTRLGSTSTSDARSTKIAPAPQMAAAPSASAYFMPASSRQRTTIGRDPDWSSLFAAARAQQPVEQLGLSFAERPVSSAKVLEMTADTWRLVNGVNSSVNRRIIYRKDASAFGTNDYWTMPIVAGGKYGDCEDFVLEKRRQLIEAGAPASALTIALVVTNTGENHAVLIVGTDKGDYVLDNLNPWVVAWSEAGYHWVARQVPGQGSLDWAAVTPRA